jgi:phosphoesterase RecJ-like protein
LIDAGVDVNDTYRRLYENVPIEKFKLIARALESIERPCEGLAVTYITEADYEQTGSGEEMTEGIIDFLRALEGVRIAAVIRELGSRGAAARKVSLRSSGDGIDVSAIAREHGGGGHVRAAGFSSELEKDEIVEYLCSKLAAG